MIDPPNSLRTHDKRYNLILEVIIYVPSVQMASKEDTPLFNPLILEKALQMLDNESLVDLSKHNCILRPLAENDFDKSFGDVLAELTPI